MKCAVVFLALSVARLASAQTPSDLPARFESQGTTSRSTRVSIVGGQWQIVKPPGVR